MADIKIYAFADEADSCIDGQIAALKRNGLDGLEIRGVDGTNVSDISVEKAKEVRKIMDSNGLITWSIGSPIGKIDINGDFSAHRDKLMRTLEIAVILAAKNMRIFSFYIPGGDKAEKYRGKVIEYMAELCEIAKTFGVDLCHENEKGIYGDIPERCLDLFKAIPGLKGIFDPANFVQCGIDTLNAWDMLKGNIYYLHIKDSKTDGTIVPAGFGGGHIKEIAKDYICSGGRHFTMEPHLAVFDGLSGLERENEKSIVTEFEYGDNNEAFDTACNTFKNIISARL